MHTSTYATVNVFAAAAFMHYVVLFSFLSFVVNKGEYGVVVHHTTSKAVDQIISSLSLSLLWAWNNLLTALWTFQCRLMYTHLQCYLIWLAYRGQFTAGRSTVTSGMHSFWSAVLRVLRPLHAGVDTVCYKCARSTCCTYGDLRESRVVLKM